jgi:hypothetical protein
VIDPEERRFYTLKQYMFLREAERAHRDLSLEGMLLTEDPAQGRGRAAAAS